jgi:hypothetical protein
MSKTMHTARKTADKAIKKIHADYPETEYTGCVGWCGPGYAMMQARFEIIIELRWRAIAKGYAY